MGANVTADFRTTKATQEGQPPLWPVGSVTSGARSFIYGPTVEVRLPHRLSLEVDALHRHISRATETIYADGRRVRWTSRGATWVFPLLAKYRFPIRGPKPFIALGPSFRLRQSFSDSSPYGITGAVGLQMRVGPMEITPAIRYTHWGSDRQAGGPFRNQAEALVGFTF